MEWLNEWRGFLRISPKRTQTQAEKYDEVAKHSSDGEVRNYGHFAGRKWLWREVDGKFPLQML
jgi:hypothetical protein